MGVNPSEQLGCDNMSVMLIEFNKKLLPWFDWDKFLSDDKIYIIPFINFLTFFMNYFHKNFIAFVMSAWLILHFIKLFFFSLHNFNMTIFLVFFIFRLLILNKNSLYKFKIINYLSIKHAKLQLSWQKPQRLWSSSLKMYLLNLIQIKTILKLWASFTKWWTISQLLIREKNLPLNKLLIFWKSIKKMREMSMMTLCTMMMQKSR